jgi:hypothetical protein
MRIANAPLPYNKAYQLMHDPKVALVQQHENGEVIWCLMPGGRVTAATAAKIIEQPNVSGQYDALFPGQHQTWRIIAPPPSGAQQERR